MPEYEIKKINREMKFVRRHQPNNHTVILPEPIITLIIFYKLGNTAFISIFVTSAIRVFLFILINFNNQQGSSK